MEVSEHGAIDDVEEMSGCWTRHRLGFAAVNDVRRRVQQEDLGHPGRKGDPSTGSGRVLRRGHEHLVTWPGVVEGLEPQHDDEGHQHREPGREDPKTPEARSPSLK